MRNLNHPSPHFNDAKMVRFLQLRAFIIALGGWGIIVSFYSVQDCSLFKQPALGILTLGRFCTDLLGTIIPQHGTCALLIRGYY